MTLLIPIGFCQAVYTLSLSIDAEDMVTTCGHDLAAFSGGTDYTAVANLLQERFATNWASATDNGYQLERTTIYVGNDGPTIVAESTLAATTGTVTGTASPPNCAYLIRKRTDLAGRRGRGRMYLPGVVGSNLLEDGSITSGWLTSLQTKASAWYDDLVTPSSGAATPPVVLHRSEGAGEEPPPTPITQFSVDPKIATQRRRLRP